MGTNYYVSIFFRRKGTFSKIDRLESRKMYNKQPCIEVENHDHQAWRGYSAMIKEVKKTIAAVGKKTVVVAVDLYPGVRVEEIKTKFVDHLGAEKVVFSDEAFFQTAEFVTEKIKVLLTDDRVFGVMSHAHFNNFIDEDKLADAEKSIEAAEGVVVVYGVAATLAVTPDIHIYANMARWEIQQRYRSGEIANWKATNFHEDALKKYKRGFFFEWRMADRYKKKHFEQFDYVIDSNIKNDVKMISGGAFLTGLKQASEQPFRVVPFFDPGVWGGQWMKEVCDLDRNVENFAWCFDCVPEENSLLLKVGETIVEIPSIDVVLRHPIALLGNQVHARFGDEFPIRFDFLDTVGGQNLSLQVHPLTEYIQEHFGMNYTQDESYYMLDTGEEAVVYLGVREGITKEFFFNELQKAQTGVVAFPAEKLVNQFPAKKHDHFLIPAGTVHCSGKDAMVLEISATPFIFTFKLWDWGRLGMDGKPRPIHLEHGAENVQFDRDTKWVENNLVNQVEKVAEGDGWLEERTGLHEREFIETRRHWFDKPVHHDTNGLVNVLNLVEGAQVMVESPENRFAPYVVNYAETFIVPASVGGYTIRPYGESVGKTVATVKAFVRV